MNPPVQDSLGPLDDEMLLAVERALPHPFPPAYVDFLRQHNGGFYRHAVVFINPANSHDSCDVSMFFGLTDDRLLSEFDARMFVTFLRDQARNLGGQYWPMALTGGGDWILIDLVTGAVAFLDHERVSAPRQLSVSFSEFVGNLSYDPNSDQFYQTQPLFQRVERGDTDEVKLALSNGADVNLTNEEGDTLLLCAVKGAQPRIVEALLDVGAYVEARDSLGRTPLCCAAGSGLSDISTMLLDGAANIDAADHDGCTPLLTAVAAGNARLVKQLARRGADVKRKDRWGQSALDLCNDRPQYDEVRALLVEIL